MHYAEKKWALICHAGSAPEASIRSKPIGSELNNQFERLDVKCQGHVNTLGNADRYYGRRKGTFPHTSFLPQPIVIYKLSDRSVSHLSLASIHGGGAL